MHTESTAVLFGTAHQASDLDRDDVIDGLRAELEVQPDLLATWFLEMPKAFDGRQEEVKGNLALGADENGIFGP